MFCKNCGAAIQNGAFVCTQCGVPVGTGNAFCPNCGQPTNPNAMVCTQCGINLNAPLNNNGYGAPMGGTAKSSLAAGLLGIFLGSLGVHNFYLGYTGKAIAQLLITLLTCGLGATISGIWGLIEGIMILTGSINTDGQGMPLRRDA